MKSIIRKDETERKRVKIWMKGTMSPVLLLSTAKFYLEIISRRNIYLTKLLKGISSLNFFQSSIITISLITKEQVRFYVLEKLD